VDNTKIHHNEVSLISILRFKLANSSEIG
jgi:hypothetical protein